MGACNDPGAAYFAGEKLDVTGASCSPNMVAAFNKLLRERTFCFRFLLAHVAFLCQAFLVSCPYRCNSATQRQSPLNKPHESSRDIQYLYLESPPFKNGSMNPLFWEITSLGLVLRPSGW